VKSLVEGKEAQTEDLMAFPLCSKATAYKRLEVGLSPMLQCYHNHPDLVDRLESLFYKPIHA